MFQCRPLPIRHVGMSASGQQCCAALTINAVDWILCRASCVPAGSLCLLMPETQGKPLPDSIEDVAGHKGPALPEAVGDALHYADQGGDQRFVLTDSETDALNRS